MKHIFIINPAAGKGKHVTGLCEKIRKVCESRQVEHHIHITTGVGDATATVRRLCGEATADAPMRFYACGGDGTLGEVASGLADCPYAELGHIPAGTGNDFVRNFTDNPRFFDIDAQLDGSSIAIDALRLPDRWCVNMINIGFDCEVVTEKERLNRKPYIPGKLAYVLGVAVIFKRMPGIRARISIDGAPAEQTELQLTTLANGECCGGGFHSNPRAALQDGMIDLLRIKPVSRMTFLRLIGSYKKGTHLNDDRHAHILTASKCRTLDMEFDGDQHICIDGEVLTSRTLHLEVVPAALRFAMPKGVALRRTGPLAAPQEVMA